METWSVGIPVFDRVADEIARYIEYRRAPAEDLLVVHGS